MTRNSHIETEALVSYIKQLKALSIILGDNFDTTKKSLDRISETWKDAKFEEFKTNFDEIYPKIKNISNFSKNASVQMATEYKSEIDAYITIKKQK